MKRKSDQISDLESTKFNSKKKLKGTVQGNIESCFRKKLFTPNILQQYTKEYAQSEPYKHAVIPELMEDWLLRKVRAEIQENVHFTPKETDIYKIHQSGDLANLDGLEDAALSKLPSLLKLRDALYSPEFRKYVATVTNSGQLSGRKTDMAINVYTPGCHLLCHDDVIGSRRVSYILYLTDPDVPWQEDWGGALRLYPTITVKDENENVTTTPDPEFTKSIPPSWNQLSFFAVQPGLSFHDVEEVYHAENQEQLEKNGGRIRMAISGWYHIPQLGEEGYVEGAEEKLAEKSSLVQLQGRTDQHDFPKEQTLEVKSLREDHHESGLDAPDIDFLLQYMSPTYLTPDTLEQVAEHFTEQSSITLESLLSPKFAARLRRYLEEQESLLLPKTSEDGLWKVARPPHKHRFSYFQPSLYQRGRDKESDVEISPIQELVEIFLPSREFRQWLQIATECEIEDFSVLARRFRHGQDYALATSHEGKPRLEICLGMTPSLGWGDDDDERQDGENRADGSSTRTSNKGEERSSRTRDTNGKGKSKAHVPLPEGDDEEEGEGEEADDVGGHEVYMAGDDNDAGADAAVYRTSTDPDDDNILFTVPACWNKMSIVLRDSGVLKFVKYVSRKAKGDRWDVVGLYGVTDDDAGEEEADENHVAGAQNVQGEGSQSQSSKDASSSFAASFSASQVTLESSGDEEEFKGFPDEDEGDSDSD